MFGHEGSHKGKAMVKYTGDTVEVIMECITCGRFSISVPALHTRSIAGMLDEIGQQLGMEKGTRVIAKHMSGDGSDFFAEGRRQFEEMTHEEGQDMLDELKETEGRPWDRRRRG